MVVDRMKPNILRAGTKYLIGGFLTGCVAG